MSPGLFASQQSSRPLRAYQQDAIKTVQDAIVIG